MKPLSESMKITLTAGAFAVAIAIILLAGQILIAVLGPGKWVVVPTNAISNYVSIMDRFSGRVFYCAPGLGCRDMKEPRPAATLPPVPPVGRSL